MIQRYYYVYRITNIKLNKHYYGSRSTPKNKNIRPHEDIGFFYFSSSTDKAFIKDQKENCDNYKYKVIQIFKTNKEALTFEIKIHNKFDVGINESFYNKAKQSDYTFTKFGMDPWNKGKTNIYSKETLEKISNSLKGNILSEEVKLKISNSCKGKVFSKEHKENLAKAALNKKYKKVICPFCLKEGGKNAMMRYHFNNCKNRLKDIK